MTDAAEPVQFVDTGNSHDYGEPGGLARLRTPFDGFAALPHAVGINMAGGRASWAHVEALHLSGWGRGGVQGSPVGVLGVVRAVPEAGVKADVTLRDQPRRPGG